MNDRITPDNIRTLRTTEVFVFGSNFDGRHGKGAAKLAWQKFGAVAGQGVGLMGQSYGLATKGHNLSALTLTQISMQVAKFIKTAKSRPDLHFLVTEIGCGLAGWKCSEIAPLFVEAISMQNVSLPERFWRSLQQC